MPRIGAGGRGGFVVLEAIPALVDDGVLLVDLMAEPLYQEIIHRGEYPSIYEGAFQNYVIDESRMFRYARRRNAADRLRTFIAEETSIQLRTVK